MCVTYHSAFQQCRAELAHNSTNSCCVMPEGARGAPCSRTATWHHRSNISVLGDEWRMNNHLGWTKTTRRDCFSNFPYTNEPRAYAIRERRATKSQADHFD